MLPHETLEAYWVAVDYVGLIDHVRPRIRRASRRDGDQLDGSGGSLLYNLIEAAAEIKPLEKAKFYRYARREVNEAFGVLFRAHRNGLITDEEFAAARHYADRLSAMLWGLIERWSK
jgi:four helix bundle protein